MGEIENEIWLPVSDFEGLYEISNIGRVRSVNKQVFNGFAYYERKGHVLAPHLRPNGYYSAMLYKDGKYKCFAVHRLVALAFLPNPENKPFIDHIDGNPQNNKLENLRWCTQKENMANSTSRERMLAARKFGPEHHCYGKHWPEERKKKMSRTIREKGFTPEQLAERAERARHIPRPHGGEHHFAKPVSQFTKDGNLVRTWPSITDAAKELGILTNAICQCLKGKSKSCAGHIWKYTTVNN